MATIEFPPVTITFGDDTALRAEIWPADLYHLEEHANTSLAALGGNISFRQLLPLAWFSLRRAGQIPIHLTLEDFVNKVKAFDLDSGVEAPKDTDPSLSTGS